MYHVCPCLVVAAARNNGHEQNKLLILADPIDTFGVYEGPNLFVARHNHATA